MPDETRYQVFVSSTYTDLKNERQAVISALLQLGSLPAGMELFPAADDDAWVLIKRVIDDSDYYLLVIGGRYGSIGEEGLSYTEKEYDYAVTEGKPVMAFLHGNPGKLALDDSEIDPEARKKYSAFREKVEHARHVKYWMSADDLAGKVALSFSSFIRTYPAAGWIRADRGDSPETLRKLAAAQEEISKLKIKLKDLAIEPPSGARGLADGDELLAVDAVIKMEILNLSSTAGISRVQTFDHRFSITWNEIFSALGPSMLDEATQFGLERRFTEAVGQVNHDEAHNVALEWITDGTDRKAFVDRDRNIGAAPRIKVVVQCRDHDFETALLQLEALGLSRKGQERGPLPTGGFIGLSHHGGELALLGFVLFVLGLTGRRRRMTLNLRAPSNIGAQNGYAGPRLYARPRSIVIRYQCPKVSVLPSLACWARDRRRQRSSSHI